MCSRDRLIIDAYFNDVISKNSNDLHDLWNLTTQPSLATSNSSLVLLGKQEEQRLVLSFTQIPNLVAAQLALSVLSFWKGQRGSSCGVSSSSVSFQITFNYILMTLPTKPQKQPITTGYRFLFGDHPSSVLSSFDRRLLWAFLGGAAPVDEDDETTTRDWGFPAPKNGSKTWKDMQIGFQILKVNCDIETSEPYEVSSNPSINLRLHSICWGHIPVHFPMFPNLLKIS